MADDVKYINANTVVNKDGKNYINYSFKPSAQKQQAINTADIVALKNALGSAEGEDSIAGRLTALESEVDTFLTGETDNSKLDTLKELVGQINENTTGIADLLADKADKANVVNSTKVRNEDEDYEAYVNGTASDDAKSRIDALPDTLTGKIASAQLVKDLENTVASNAQSAETTYRKIADSYTKTEIDNKIANRVQAVEALPETPEANVTYLVIDADEESTGSGD